MAVVTAAAAGDDRAGTFARIRELACARAGRVVPGIEAGAADGGRSVPRLSEPWYCCAEPTEGQLSSCLGSAGAASVSFTITADRCREPNGESSNLIAE